MSAGTEATSTRISQKLLKNPETDSAERESLFLPNARWGFSLPLMLLLKRELGVLLLCVTVAAAPGPRTGHRGP